MKPESMCLRVRDCVPGEVDGAEFAIAQEPEKLEIIRFQLSSKLILRRRRKRGPSFPKLIEITLNFQ